MLNVVLVESKIAKYCTVINYSHVYGLEYIDLQIVKY